MDPRQWAGGPLRDWQVFLGRGRVRATVWPCCMALMLLSSPCTHRKYLRDADRQVLAQRAFILTVKVLEDTLSELAEVRGPLPSPLPGGSPSPPLPCPWAGPCVPVYGVALPASLGG